MQHLLLVHGYLLLHLLRCGRLLLLMRSGWYPSIHLVLHHSDLVLHEEALALQVLLDQLLLRHEELRLAATDYRSSKAVKQNASLLLLLLLSCSGCNGLLLLLNLLLLDLLLLLLLNSHMILLQLLHLLVGEPSVLRGSSRLLQLLLRKYLNGLMLLVSL